MDLSISHDNLVHLISALGRRIVDARQVAKRVRQLLPNRLKQLERSHRCKHTCARATRRALLDPAYLRHIDEYLEVAEKARSASVTWQSHSMLYRARQSLRRLGSEPPQIPSPQPQSSHFPPASR